MPATYPRCDSPRGRTTLAVGLMLLSLLSGCGGTDDDTPRLFDLEGRETHPLSETGSRAIVFLFTRTDCPISNRYAPEVERLRAELQPKGVTFWLVFPDPKETAGAIRNHMREYGYGMEALRDPEHRLVDLTGVRVTPEAAIFVPAPDAVHMVYRGRIDDRYLDFGSMRPEPTTHDVERVLNLVLSGGPVAYETTTAAGCFIPEIS